MENSSKQELFNNIDFSEEWLLAEIIKLHSEQRNSGQVQYVKMKKIDLLNLVLKFIKLNRRGE